MSDEQNEIKKRGKKDIPKGTHVWDDDLYELNTPIPNWWLKSFYATIVIAIVYWILYPAWPGIAGVTKGTLGWTSGKQLKEELIEAEKLRNKYFNQIDTRSIEEIKNDSDLYPFVQSVGSSVFRIRCSRCHGSGGQGKAGMFPSLVDDEWIHGGALKNIYKTIKEGQKNKMPAHKERIGKDEIEQVVEYVYSLSSDDFNRELAEKGKEVFLGEDAECYDCHGEDAKGDIEVGAPNLTDQIWLYGGDKSTILETVTYGRKGVMPPWKDELTDSEIKALTVYVKTLSE